MYISMFSQTDEQGRDSGGFDGAITLQKACMSPLVPSTLTSHHHLRVPARQSALCFYMEDQHYPSASIVVVAVTLRHTAERGITPQPFRAAFHKCEIPGARSVFFGR